MIPFLYNFILDNISTFQVDCIIGVFHDKIIIPHFFYLLSFVSIIKLIPKTH
eukprot:UN00625